MMQKGNQTKNRIIQAAKILFLEKGYASVTMSDVCEATKLSRGGLYRYFDSVEEIFMALLTDDKDSWQTEMEQAIKDGVPAATMLNCFLNRHCPAFQRASVVYLWLLMSFARDGNVQRSFITARYSYAVDMMEHLLRYGQLRGEFRQFDTRVKAEQLVIFIDGLKMACSVLSIPTEAVTKQTDTLLEELIKEKTI